MSLLTKLKYAGLSRQKLINSYCFAIQSSDQFCQSSFRNFIEDLKCKLRIIQVIIFILKSLNFSSSVEEYLSCFTYDLRRQDEMDWEQVNPKIIYLLFDHICFCRNFVHFVYVTFPWGLSMDPWHDGRCFAGWTNRSCSTALRSRLTTATTWQLLWNESYRFQGDVFIETTLDSESTLNRGIMLMEDV